MPCYDGGPSPREQEAMDVEAILCGIVHTLMSQHMLSNVLNAVNWKEAGVERYKFEKWWNVHTAQDVARRQHEAEQTRVANLRATAEAKLTLEELAAIRGR